jgi:hypothetical protein
MRTRAEVGFDAANGFAGSVVPNVVASLFVFPLVTFTPQTKRIANSIGDPFV